MSRAAKLYERLQDLEIEYLRLLKAELQKVIDGADSWYLMIGRGYQRTKTYRTADDQQIQSLDTEIQRLRQKLKEPTPELYRKIDGFIAGATISFPAPGACPQEICYPRDKRTAMARNILVELDNYIEALG